MMQWVVEEVSVVKFNNINTAFGRVTRFRWWEAKSGQWHTPVNNQQQQRLRQPAETTTNEKKHPGKKTLKSRNAAPVGITFLDYVTWDRLNWHWVFHPLGGHPVAKNWQGKSLHAAFFSSCEKWWPWKGKVPSTLICWKEAWKYHKNHPQRLLQFFDIPWLNKQKTTEITIPNFSKSSLL